MTATAPPSAIAARRVTLRFKRRMILDGVDVAAAPGAIVALVGPNGAGKSTLLKVLAGILAPAAGRVEINGAPQAAMAPAERARRIAYLAQERTVHWPMSVRATAALGRIPHLPPGRRPGAHDAAAIDAALAAMDVTALADRPILELSGGERARALLARALAQEPMVLLADEPTAGLDPAHQIALLRHLAALAGGGRTIVLALHDLALAARFATHIVLMQSGRIVADGRADDVLTTANLAAVYGITVATIVIDGVRIVVPRDVVRPAKPC